MEFEFSADQQMLYDLVARLAAEEHDFAVRRRVIASESGWDRRFWLKLGELGILGAGLPETAGGIGGGGVETMLILTALSRGLVISPFVPTIVCSAALLARCGSDAQIGDHLPEILAGRRIFAFCGTEQGSFADPLRIETTAIEQAGGYLLNGRKSLVLGGPWADFLLVIARLPSALPESAAFIVPAGAAGVTARHFRTIGGERASEIAFDHVFVPAHHCVGGGQNMGDALLQTFDEALVAFAAEACGAASAIIDATVEYSKIRRQFGRSIVSNQSIAHRIVDMSIASERLNAMTHRAALSLKFDHGSRQLATSAAKATVGRLGRWIGQAAVQIHGGIGVMDEPFVTHHVRKLEQLDQFFGSADDHVDRYANLLNIEGLEATGVRNAC